MSEEEFITVEVDENYALFVHPLEAFQFCLEVLEDVRLMIDVYDYETKEVDLASLDRVMAMLNVTQEDL